MSVVRRPADLGPAPDRRACRRRLRARSGRPAAGLGGRFGRARGADHGTTARSAPRRAGDPRGGRGRARRSVGRPAAARQRAGPRRRVHVRLERPLAGRHGRHGGRGRVAVRGDRPLASGPGPGSRSGPPAAASAASRPSAGRRAAASMPAPKASLRSGGLDVGSAGTILVVGSRVDAETLTRARAMGVCGVVVAGLSSKERRDFIASEARQRAALHRLPPFAVLVLDGATRRPLAGAVQAVLAALVGREVAIVTRPADARLRPAEPGDPRPAGRPRPDPGGIARRPRGTVRARRSVRAGSRVASISRRGSCACPMGPTAAVPLRRPRALHLTRLRDRPSVARRTNRPSGTLGRR